MGRRNQLYKNLINSKAVTEYALGTENEFISAMSSPEKAGKIYDNLINKTKLTAENIGTREQFIDFIAPDFGNTGNKGKQDNIFSEEYLEQVGEPSNDFLSKMANPLETPFSQYIDETISGKQKVEIPYLDSWGKVKKAGQEYEKQKEAEKLYRQSIDNETDRIQDEINKLQKDPGIRRAMSQDISRRSSSPLSYSMMSRSEDTEMTSQEDYLNLKTAASLISDAKKTANASKNKSGFWKGVGDSLISEEAVSLGLSSIENTLRIMPILDKVEKEGIQSLTPSENTLLEAASVKSLSDMIYESGLSTLYNVGSATGTSIPYMLQFVITRAPASAIAKPVMKKLTGYVTKRFGEAAIKKAAARAISTLPKVGTKTALKTANALTKTGVAALEAGATGALMPIIQPSMYNDILERRMGQVDADINPQTGKVQYKGQTGEKSWGKSIGEGFTAGAIENLAEMSGGAIMKTLGVPVKALSKVSPKSREFINIISEKPLLRSFNRVREDIAKTTGVHSIPGEALEEFVGQTANALTVGDQKLEDIYTWENAWMTLASVAPLSIGMGSASGVMAQATKKKVVRDYNRASQKLSEAYSPDLVEYIKSRVGGSPEQQAMIIRQYYDRAREAKNEEEKRNIANEYRLVMDYAAAVNNYDAYIGGIEARVANEVSALSEQIRNDINPDMNATVYIDYDGQMARVTSGNIVFDENGDINDSKSDDTITIELQDGTKQMVSPDKFKVTGYRSFDDQINEATQNIENTILSQEDTDVYGPDPVLDEALYINTDNGPVSVKVTRADYGGFEGIQIDESGKEITEIINGIETPVSIPFSKDQIIRPDNPTIETENNTVAEDVRPLQAGDVINVTGFQNPVTFVSESNGDAIVGLLDNMGNPIINTEGKQVQVPVKSEQIIHSQTQSQEIKEETSDSASPVEEEVIPMRKNKKGEQVKDYVSMPDNMFVEHMINDYGNEAAKEGLKDRKRNIDSLINRLKKRRDKSTNTNEKIDIDDEINDLKSRLQILEELSQNLPNEPNSFKERLNSLSEPVSLEDYILQGIASGEYKFKWGGKNGLSDELGLKSDRERRSRIGILKNDGYTPETLAERIFQEIEYGQLPFSVEELEIRNSIIDILNRVHSRKRALEESESLQKEFEDQQIRVQEQNSDVVEELTPEELQEIDEAIAELKPIDDIRFRTNMSSSSENLNNETLNNGNKNTALFNIESINDFAGMTPEQKIVFNAVIDMLKDANIPVEVLTNNQINSLVEFQNSRLMTVYHGSGAKFDAFDHSHIGEGEGAQAYGWGSYVTEVEGIGRTYAESNSGNIFKSGFGDFYLQEIRKGLAEGNQFEDIKQKLLSYHADMYEKAGGNIEMYGDFISDYETLQQLKENDLPKRNLYTVEIPDNTGNNYLVWNEEVNETQKEEIISSLSEIYDEDFDFDYFLDKMDQYEYEYNLTGEGLYKLLSKYGFNNNSQKASNILQQIGYTGISYPAQYRTGGRSDGAKNYVIFNENDLKIKDRISFFKDNKGIIYGATINGEIYLNGSALNPETPIHEYTHIWDYACKDNNPELWNRGIKLMKQTTVWEEVKNDPNYSDLQTDDEIASEVHSRLTGKDSTKLMENIVSKASRKSSLEIVKAISLRENLKKWISDFWWWLKDTMSPWTKNKSSKVSLEDFVNMPLKDLVIGTKLNIKINHKSFKTQNKNNLLNNQKENNDITSFAIRHNLIEKDVQDYADYMRQGNLNGASGAFTDIRRKVRIDNKGVSLGEFTKIFSPIRQELYEKFGNVDELREQYVQTEMEKRDMMDAARKRAEDAAEAERKRLQEFQGMSDEQLDEEYFKAIDTNDESRMRDLVNEAARRNGYGDVGSEYQGVGAWSAPSNPGYESDEERRAAVENESPDVNVTDIANGYLQQPDDYFTNLRAYGNNNPHGRESAEAINNAMDDVRKGKDPKIKVYRAVPKTVKEGTLRNGDWVTPSRKYAEMHGNNRLEGDYRIIEQEVSASQLWWDGNDINEWGFDDGKRYAYRNTRNNRKLNDLITRDDKGNVIPLSKRFNSRKEDTRFRFIGEEGAANLDRSEEATTRLDNLNVAREMENAFEEKKARIEKLRNSEPVEITGNEITPSEDLKQYKKNALEYGKKLQGEYTNKDTGRTIQLQRGRKNGGIKEVLSHDTLNDTAQIKSIAAIPSIIENAIYIDSSENQDTHKNPNVVSYHYYICGLKIGGEDYTVRMVEAEEKDGSRYYDHRLTHIEKGKLINELALINSSSSTELSSTPDAEAEDRNRPTNRGEIQTAPISNIKDTRLISLLQTNNQENARKIKLATGWERGADGKWQHDTEAKLQIPKEEKINEIKRLSDILNTEVEIYDTQADLPTNIREKANGEISGYYMPGNDKVAIVLDANTSIGDIQATMLHEIVGHKGIRGLFGNRTDEFLDKVFESMDANVRAEYMERFNSERLAAEEYLSELAEYNPETSGIKKIIAIIRDFFREILGIDLKLSDNDIVYILSKSRERLQNSRNLSENKPLNESYSPNEESNLTETNRIFNDRLSELTEQNSDNIVLDLGNPSEILLSAGIEDKPMKLYGNKVIKKMKKHGFKLEELRNLPEAVANPIAVFNNYQKDGNRSILTELRTEQGNFLVTLDLGKDADVDFNIVTSVFGKGDNNIIDWINKGYATYIDKKKALGYLHFSERNIPEASNSREMKKGQELLSHQSAPIAATAASSDLVSATNIVKEFENPTIPDKNEAVEKRIQQETEETLYRLKSPVKVDVSGDSAIEAAEKISGAQYLQRVIDKDIYRNISYNTLNRNAIQAVGYGRKKLRYFDKRKMENAYKGLFDNMNDLHNLQKTIIDTYGSIDDSLNAYYAENASSSRAQDRTNRFQVEYEQPLINTLAKIRKKFNNDDFMMKYYPSVRTIIERQKVITDREIKKAQNDPKIKDDRQSLFAAIQLAEKKDYAGQTGTYKEILAHEYPEFKFPANFETMTYDEVKDFAKENNLISMEDFVERSENILGNDLVNEFWNNVRKISQYKLYNDYQTGMISRDMFEELTYGVTMKELAKKRLDAGEIKQEQYDLVLNTFNRPESLLSRGIITKDQYNSLKPRYEYYLPLKGTSDVEADDINEYNNKKVKNISALKAVEGHENVARDPLPQLLQDVYGSIMSQEQNRWRNTLLNMLRKYPMPDLYHIQTEYFTPIRNEKGNIIEYVPYVKIVNDKLIFVPTDEELKAKTAIRKRKGLDLDIEINKRQSSEHTVTFLENGDYVTVYFTDPRIAQSINNLNVNTLPTFLDSIMKWGGKINRFRSQFMTTANPEFVIANVIKDFQEANSNILIKEGLKYWKEFNKIYLNPELGAAIRRRLNGKKGDTEIDKYVDEFFKYGGETAYNMLPGYEQKRKDLYKEIKKVNKEGNKAILVGSKVKDWAKDNLEMLNKQAELRARIATYVTSRKHTKREISRSIWDAKEITVNFDKKGSWAKGFGFWQLFWNAGRQSNRMQIQMIKTHPIKWAIAKSVNTAIGFAETVLPWLILDDDDRKNYLDKYFSITPYLRYSNLIMGFGGELVTIPLPPAFIPSHTLGVCMAEMVLRNNEPGFDPTALVIDVANAGANEWLPEFIVDPVFDIANRKDFVISSIVPAQLKPFAEIYDNRNFFGSPIYNDNINEFKPAYQRIYNGTGPTYVNISQTLNNWTGGNEVDRGFIQLNPAILEHLVEGYVSGLGKFGEKAFTTLSGNAESSKDIPVLGRFWRGDIEYYLDRDEKNTYYRLLKQAEEYRYRRNEYRKLNGYESEKEELKKEGELYEPILIQIRKLNRYKRLEKNTSDPKKKEKYKNKQNEVYKKVQQIEEEYNNKKFNQ